MSCCSLDGTGVWGRMDTCIYMAESLCCSSETTTTLLIGYTPIQNKMFLFSCSVVSDSLWPHESQHARPLWPSPTPVYSNSCASSWWCHPAISSSVVPFSSCLQSFPASRSFRMSRLFASGGQNVQVWIKRVVECALQVSGRVRAGHQAGMWIVGCHVWRRETSVPFPQFCCEPKTALKMEILKKKKKRRRRKGSLEAGSEEGY